MTDNDIFDFIVVGGGSAGSVVAGRLAATQRYRVLLLEAGGWSRNPWVGIPLGTPKLFDDPRLNWCYESEPEPELNDRRMFQPRGKLLGGTGAINGMAYVRGHRDDFDGWRDLGNVGWSYDDVLPFFKANEDNVRGANEYHAVGGPMHVADQAIHREIGDAFVAAALEMGYRRNDDFNGRDQEGIGYFQWNYRRGRRVNPADVYLRAPALKRYVTIVSGAHARAVTFEGGDAVGVEYRHQGTVRTARARREIVLCAGAFNSPQLLQLSGIGDAATLRRYGISVIRDAPAVGANYKDHFTVQMPFACNRNDTLNDDIGTAYRKVRMGLLYLFGLKGPMAHPGTYSGGFLRTSEEVSRPDIELNCNLWTRKYAKTGGGLLDRFSGFTLLPLYLRPDATGTVTIRSPNPEAAPEIRCNMFGSDRDRRTMVRAVRILRTIANAPALKPYIVREVGPGEVAQSDEEIVEYIRENGYTAFHPVGTCRMGKDDDAVVDARLRVRGVNRLRVVDASIMPTITSGNTNAPTMMIGEKGAHMILEDAAADRSRS